MGGRRGPSLHRSPGRQLTRSSELVASSAHPSFASGERRDRGGKVRYVREPPQARPGEDALAPQVPGLLFNALEPGYL